MESNSPHILVSLTQLSGHRCAMEASVQSLMEIYIGTTRETMSKFDHVNLSSRLIPCFPERPNQYLQKQPQSD